MGEQKLSAKDALKILAISGIVLSSFLIPAAPMAFHELHNKWQKYKKGDIVRIIRRFHKQKLLNLTEKDGKTLIELSDKGKKRLLLYDFEKIELKKRYDGKPRMVMFDIPRKKNSKRDLLRRKLVQLGFVKLQESVFVTPYICEKEINFIINYLGIADHVILLQMGKIEISATNFEFKKMYN